MQTSQEKVDFLLKLTQATISLPKFTEEKGKPKLTGSVTVSLFPDQELMLFRSMITTELTNLFPELKPEEPVVKEGWKEVKEITEENKV